MESHLCLVLNKGNQLSKLRLLCPQNFKQAAAKTLQSHGLAIADVSDGVEDLGNRIEAFDGAV
eukprot:scaffold611487_cov38-Prasinocladus_malaysianus.AAC.1